MRDRDELSGYASSAVVNPAEADILVAAVAGRLCASYISSKTHSEEMELGNPHLHAHSSLCVIAMRDLLMYEVRVADVWKSMVL